MLKSNSFTCSLNKLKKKKKEKKKKKKKKKRKKKKEKKKKKRHHMQWETFQTMTTDPVSSSNCGG